MLSRTTSQQAGVPQQGHGKWRRHQQQGAINTQLPSGRQEALGYTLRDRNSTRNTYDHCGHGIYSVGGTGPGGASTTKHGAQTAATGTNSRKHLRTAQRYDQGAATTDSARCTHTPCRTRVSMVPIRSGAGRMGATWRREAGNALPAHEVLISHTRNHHTPHVDIVARAGSGTEPVP